MFTLDPGATALVLIDVQNGTLAMPMGPHAPQAVVANAVLLAERFAAAGATVVSVSVNFSSDLRDTPHRLVDVALAIPPGGPPPGFADPPPALAGLAADIRIVKRQWSAFYGTELDLQLRRRGISTVVIGGLMTNFGVESTARDAWQHNYAVVVAEDATSAPNAAMHAFAITATLPRVSRVRSTADIVSALGKGAGGTPS